MILQLYTGRVKDRKRQPTKETPWQKTQYANLIRYKPSGQYFARCRVQGKLIVRRLKTDRISVAQMRLADLIKEERTKAEDGVKAESGKLTFESAAAILLDRIDGNADLKPRTRAYYRERLDALYRSWPELKNAAKRVTFSPPRAENILPMSKEAAV